MGDVFKEQIVKKKPDKKDLLMKTGAIAAGVVFIAGAMLVPILQPFILFIMAAVGFGVYFFITYLYIEYEYIYTNGELDIDAIHNRSRRKRIFSGSVRDFEIMAHIDDKNHIGSFSSASEVKDYSSGVTGPNTYAFLTNYKGKKMKIIIEPNDVLLQAFSTVLTPRKLFKKV